MISWQMWCACIFNYFISFLGSSKIATKCTSTITIKVDHEEQVHVDICYTHHGHRKSLEHLRLPKCQRAMIAAKIQQGVTRERIIDHIRESLGETFQRQHLANLESAFGLQRVQRHGNDQLSVLAWIGEWQSSEESESPVLYSGGRERLYCFPLFAHGQLITTSVTSHSNRSKLSLAWLV